MSALDLSRQQCRNRHECVVVVKVDVREPPTLNTFQLHNVTNCCFGKRSVRACIIFRLV
jgi:hypothetical protein